MEANCDIKRKNIVEEEDSDAFSDRMSQSTSANTIIGNPDYVLDNNDTWSMKHQDSRDSGICDQRAISHESLPHNESMLATQPGVDSLENGDICSSGSDVRLVAQQAEFKSDGARFSPDCNRISPIEEFVCESASSHCSDSGSLSLGNDLDETEVAAALKDVITDLVVEMEAGENIAKLESESPTDNDVVESVENITNEITNDEILVKCDDVDDDVQDLVLPGARLDLPDSNLLHVEDAASSACGSTNTSPSKSIYSEVASESDTYFDASEMPGAASDDVDTSIEQTNHDTEENITKKKCDSVVGKDTLAASSDAEGQTVSAQNQETVPLRVDVNHFENPEASGKSETGVTPKLKTSKANRGFLKTSKESFYRRRVRDLVGHRQDDRYQKSGLKLSESVSSSCSTCASDSDIDNDR
jgi:hypothetical protein